jgi:hypothetical protein
MARINAVMVPVMLVGMWFVAPHGIVWVATVHLVVAATFTLVRQIVANRIVSASMLSALRALVPGLVVTACVLACALPVRLNTSVGFGPFLMIVAAGVVGGLLGLAVSRGARDEAKDLLVKLRG